MTSAIQRYSLFCLAVLCLFAIYSYGLDFIYYKRDYGTFNGYHYTVLDYFFRFLLWSFPFSILIPCAYNYFINRWVNQVPGKIIFRFIAGACIGLLFGYIAQRRVTSFYIGQWRDQKSVILFLMIGISVEVLRMLKQLWRVRRMPVTIVVSTMIMALLIPSNAKSQSNCLKDTTFLADSLGDGTGFLPIRLSVKFENDSIKISYPNSAREFMIFRIVSKDSCQFDNDFSLGTATYHLEIETRSGIKHPLMHLYLLENRRYLEIEYEGAEKRVFIFQNRR
ncbi:MAG: hypothetical protein ABI480_03715 [Chitinophagaceae bacterium]